MQVRTVLQTVISLKTVENGTSKHCSIIKRTYGVILWTMLIKIQLEATICRYLFTAQSLYMFRMSPHPSSGVLKTVTAASGTGHNTGTATSLQRDPIGPRWREVAVPVPEAAVTVFSAPDDGCCDTRNM